MESKKVTNPIQTQLLLEMGVPADTADMYHNPGTSRLMFVQSGLNISDIKPYLSWTIDALTDYLCDDDNVRVAFRRSNGMWICYYTNCESWQRIDCSKIAPSKIDAIFEVIYELHRSKYDTGTEKKEN